MAIRHNQFSRVTGAFHSRPRPRPAQWAARILDVEINAALAANITVKRLITDVSSREPTIYTLG
jgi:hypothetical protein